jgi:predicted GIY-YIG superfamily endonuclease
METTVSDLEARPHALYRFFDVEDRLLYIGITAGLPQRLMRHADGKPWWLQVAKITVEVMPGRAEVLAAERAAIRAERPLYNIRHNNGDVLMPEEKPESIADSFIGSFFLSDAKRGWQGVILERIDSSHLFVETFSWVNGANWSRHVVSIEEMMQWRFYESARAMREHYARTVQYLWAQERGGPS